MENGDLYKPIEWAIREDFLQDLLSQPIIGDDLCNQITLTVNRSGLGIPYPKNSAAENRAALMDFCTVLVEILLTWAPLDIKEHQRHAANGKKESKARHNKKELNKLTKLKREVGRNAARQMYRACKSGSWMTVMPSFLDETELLSQEFRDNVRWILGLMTSCLLTNSAAENRAALMDFCAVLVESLPTGLP